MLLEPGESAEHIPWLYSFGLVFDFGVLTVVDKLEETPVFFNGVLCQAA